MCSDNVNHPSHYEGNTFLDCIEVMQVTFGTRAVKDFCVCNCFKYLWRYKNKNGEEDIKKAEWYLNYYWNFLEYPMEDDTYRELKYLLNKIKEKVVNENKNQNKNQKESS